MTPHSSQDVGQPVDLTNCDREPIHILGRVQSYGALLAVSADWMVQHASANLEAVLGVPAGQAVGAPLGKVISAEAMTRLQRRMRDMAGDEPVARLFGVEVNGPGQRFDVSMHRSGRHLVVEFERKAGGRGRDAMDKVLPHVQPLRLARDMETLADKAAQGLRAICGFDSVMVYQFQPDQSGKVIAEAKAPGGASYLGLRFPASDIPVQARALYKRSLLRLIADVNDPGVPLVPRHSPEGVPLDLSLAVTRAVSPIHIEYLRNMGVSASMSVSIMKDGELWGLFACHHRSPRYIDYEMRTTVELFGHLFSYEVARFEQEQRSAAEAEAARLHARLMATLADDNDLAAGVLGVARDIDRIIPMDGLVLFHEDRFHAQGSTLTEEEFRVLVKFLNTTVPSEVFATDCLSKLHPPAEAYRDRVAGLLAIPISRSPRDFLVLCRRAVATSVQWAGDPAKPATVGPNGVRLTPRESFEVWRELVEGTSDSWSIHDRAAAERIRVLMLEVFLRLADAASAERKRAQERQELLISELNHRVRNILNLTRGLVSQSRAGQPSVAEFAEAIDGRISALARAHDQLTCKDWAPSSVTEVIRLEAAAYVANEADRLQVAGDDVLLLPEALTNLALVFHEMVTNSAKYGALRDAAGRVQVTLSRDVDEALVIDWKEVGGRPVTAPTRRGFGSTIIETSIPYELQGAARIDFRLTGVEAEFRIPARYVAAAPMPAWQGGAPDPSGAPVRLTGRALVVEDSMIIAMDTSMILADIGASEAPTAASVADALRLLSAGDFQVAVLDVNLGSETSVTVAQALADRGIPFVLTTGYGDSADLAAAYPPCPVVQKPISNETLEAAVRRALDPS